MSDEQKQDMNQFVARLGTFFILLGIFFLIMFIASDAAKQPNFDYLLFGLVGLGFGLVFRRRASPPSPSGRFGWYKNLREKSKQRKENKGKKEA
jgi:MYXO-CTERM domain-containing protein